MKTNSILFILILSVSINSYSQCPETFHNFSALDIHGEELQMSVFEGKKLLIVNTASFCGYTYQYEQLQQLYETYGGIENPYNFEIIGFPANNFGNQEPHGEDSIIQVCEQYGVTFTMMSKISVKGSDQHPIYQWLTQFSRNCVQNAAVTWNFQKFMINPDGSWAGVAQPATSPLNATIVNWITSTADIQENHSKPKSVQISQNMSNNTIYIDFYEQIHGYITINLYDIIGNHITTIFNGVVESETQISHTQHATSSGIYIVELKGNDINKHQKIFLH